jgi:WD40 repeat protein
MFLRGIMEHSMFKNQSYASPILMQIAIIAIIVSTICIKAFGTTPTLTLVKRIQIDPRGTSGGSDGTQFNRNGNILSVSNDIGICFLYDVSTWNKLLEVKHFTGSDPGFDEQINNISFTPDNALFATGMNYTGVKIWNTSTGALIKHLGNGTNSDGLGYSPNGTWIAVASDNNCIVYTTSAYSKVLTTSFNSGKECNSIDWTPDSRYLFAAGDSRIKIYSTSNWSLAKTLQVSSGSVKSIRVNPTGTMIVGTGNTGTYTGIATIYSIPDGNELANVLNYSPAKIISGDDDDGTTPNIEDACWTPDGKYLLTGSVYDGIIHVYRVRDWSLVAWIQGQAYGRQIEAIDCNKDFLVSSSGDEGYVYIHKLNIISEPGAFIQSSSGDHLLCVETENNSSNVAMGNHNAHSFLIVKA